MPMNYPEWRANQETMEAIGKGALLLVAIPIVAVALKEMYERFIAPKPQPPAPTA